MTYHETLRVLPLVSAILWSAVGLWPIVRREARSPFERATAAFGLLMAAWAFLDWVFLGMTDADLAVAISNVRISVITVAMFALLLGSKWLVLGHSRVDALLVLPVLGSLGIVWTGLTSGVEFVWWGPRLVRDPFRYTLWAAQQVAYVGASIVLAVTLYRERRSAARRLRRRMLWTGGSLLSLLALWLGTNLYNNVTQTAGLPWFSSLLAIPAGIALAQLVRMSPREVSAARRAISDVEGSVRAVYLFHDSGEPLVALSSGRTFPIEAERLQTILAAVGGFVEKSIESDEDFGVTGMRFDEQGVIAVRGRHLIAAALYDGNVYDAIRSELVRIVHALEERFWSSLGSWEEASRIAEGAADDLSSLLQKPTRTDPQRARLDAADPRDDEPSPAVGRAAP